MWEVLIKYNSDHWKHKYEVVEEPKNNGRIFLGKILAIRVSMDCRTTSAHKFRIRLGFKQYGVILTKEESMLTKAMFSPEG